MVKLAAVFISFTFLYQGMVWACPQTQVQNNYLAKTSIFETPGGSATKPAPGHKPAPRQVIDEVLGIILSDNNNWAPLGEIAGLGKKIFEKLQKKYSNFRTDSIRVVGEINSPSLKVSGIDPTFMICREDGQIEYSMYELWDKDGNVYITNNFYKLLNIYKDAKEIFSQRIVPFRIIHQLYAHARREYDFYTHISGRAWHSIDDLLGICVFTIEEARWIGEARKGRAITEYLTRDPAHCVAHLKELQLTHGMDLDHRDIITFLDRPDFDDFCHRSDLDNFLAFIHSKRFPVPINNMGTISGLSRVAGNAIGLTKREITSIWVKFLWNIFYLALWVSIPTVPLDPHFIIAVCGLGILTWALDRTLPAPPQIRSYSVLEIFFQIFFPLWPAARQMHLLRQHYGKSYKKLDGKLGKCFLEAVRGQDGRCLLASARKEIAGFLPEPTGLLPEGVQIVQRMIKLWEEVSLHEIGKTIKIIREMPGYDKDSDDYRLLGITVDNLIRWYILISVILFKMHEGKRWLYIDENSNLLFNSPPEGLGLVSDVAGEGAREKDVVPISDGLSIGEPLFPHNIHLLFEGPFYLYPEKVSYVFYNLKNILDCLNGSKSEKAGIKAELRKRNVSVTLSKTDGEQQLIFELINMPERLPDWSSIEDGIQEVRSVVSLLEAESSDIAGKQARREHRTKINPILSRWIRQDRVIDLYREQDGWKAYGVKHIPNFDPDSHTEGDYKVPLEEDKFRLSEEELARLDRIMEESGINAWAEETDKAVKIRVVLDKGAVAWLGNLDNSSLLHVGSRTAALWFGEYQLRDLLQEENDSLTIEIFRHKLEHLRKKAPDEGDEYERLVTKTVALTQEARDKQVANELVGEIKKADSAEEEKVIVAIDNDLVGVQDIALPVIAVLQRYCGANNRYKNISIIRGSGNKDGNLAQKIESELREAHGKNVKLAVIYKNDNINNVTITARKNLIEHKIISVDDSQLMSGDGKVCYFPVAELVTLALRILAADDEGTKDIYREITGIELKSSDLRDSIIHLILPRAEPTDYEALRRRYEAQAQLFKSA